MRKGRRHLINLWRDRRRISMSAGLSPNAVAEHPLVGEGPGFLLAPHTEQAIDPLERQLRARYERHWDTVQRTGFNLEDTAPVPPTVEFRPETDGAGEESHR